MSALVEPMGGARMTTWLDSAACRETDPETFFPEGWGATYASARKVCAACQVVAECLADALAHETGGTKARFGLRGGKTPAERAEIAGSRGRTPGSGRRSDPMPCGTYAAYRRHFRRGERPCRLCLDAAARHRAARTAARRSA